MMRGRGMAAGYSQGLCFIPGAKIGPVPVYDTFMKKTCKLCSIEWGGGGGGGAQDIKRHKQTIFSRLERLIGRF